MARNTRNDPWAEQLAEAPRADVPNHKERRRWNFLRKYLLVAAPAAPVLLVLNIVLLGNSAPDAGASASTGTDALAVVQVEDRQARATAINAVESWLASVPSPLPTGKLVSWDGAEVIPDAAEPENGKTREELGWPDLEVHSMTLTVASGRLYQAEITLQRTAAGAVPASAPSLVPFTPTSSSATASTPWPGASTRQAPAPVIEAATAWAEAYTSGDSAKLRLHVGDEQSGNAYIPLAGVQLSEFAVRVAAVHPSAEKIADDPNAMPNMLMVRAEGRLTWPGQADSGSASDNRKVSYDLLLSGANTGSPRVVAWGGPGTGPSLQPYQNAAVGVEVVTSQDEEG